MNEPSSKSFSRRLAEGVFWSSSLSVGTKVIGLALTFLTLRYLGLHEYGTYQLTLAAWGLLTILMFNALDKLVIAAGSRALGDGDVPHSTQLGRGLFFFKLVVGVVLWALVFFGSQALHPWYSGDILVLLKILSWTFIITPFSSLLVYDLSIRQRFFSISLLPLVEDGLKLGLLMLAFYVFHARIEGVLWALTGAAALVNASFLPLVSKSYFSSLRGWSFRPFFLLISGPAAWLFLQKQLRQLDRNIRPFFIQYLLGREAVALFGLAEKLLTHLIGLVPIGDILIPLVSREASDIDRQRRILEKGIKYSVPFYLFLAFVAALAARPFLQGFFPQYVPALPLFYCLLSYLPFSGVSFLLASFYYSYRDQKLDFYLAIGRSLFFVIFAVAFFKAFGLYGVAIEYASNMILYVCVRYVLMVRMHPELHIHLSTMMRFDGYDRVVLAKIMGRIPIGKRKK